MANTFLSRSNSSGTSTQKGTISVWIKGSEEPSGNNQTTLACWGNANNHGALIWNGGDKIDAFDYQSGYASQLQTNALLRDSSAWYHIVYAWDTTLSTANDRQKIYINGIEQTYSTRTNYSTNAATSWNANSYSMRVGGLNSSSYFNGLMSHIHFIDGIAYAPTLFGETDSTTGQWKIKTSPSVTYGNNGFFILKDGNTITDSSSNSNNFSLSGGTLTKTEDCPDNNFATFNPLDNFYFGGAYINGNTTLTTDAAKFGYTTGTIGSSKGKYYWEMKLIQASGGNYHITGVAAAHQISGDGLGYLANGYAYQGYDGKIRANGSVANYGATWSTNDIIGTAIDLDNNKLYFSKNGVFQNSGNPASGSTGTGAFALTAPASTPLGAYLPATGDHAGSSYAAAKYSYNFGNGYFGTTAISSAGTNASGNGIFEYDVPSGYTALSTKGLNL